MKVDGEEDAHTYLKHRPWGKRANKEVHMYEKLLHCNRKLNDVLIPYNKEKE